MWHWLFAPWPAIVGLIGLAEAPPTGSAPIKPAAESPYFGASRTRPEPQPGREDPDRPGGEDLASKIFEAVSVQIVAATEPGREPEWASEAVPGRLLVRCNLNGRRFEVVLIGDKIEPIKEQVWRVDGRPFQLSFLDPPPPPTRVPADAEGYLKMFRDANLASFRDEQNFDLVPGSETWLKLPTGEPVWYGEVAARARADVESHKGVARVLMSHTVRNRYIVAFAVPLQDGDAVEGSGAWLRRTALSLKPLADLPPARAPLTADDILRRGLTLEQTIRLHHAITGRRLRPVVNRQVASPRDRALAGGLALAPSRLIPVLKVHLWRQQIAPDLPAALGPEVGIGSPTMMSVYDGQSGHSLMIVGFVRGSGRFVLQEVWPKGSFLERANNEAGVDAKPVAGRPKEFTVTPAELERVLYSVLLEDDEFDFAARVTKWLDTDAKALAASLKALHDDRADDPSLNPKVITALGLFFLEERDHDRASAVFEALNRSHPESAMASYGLAQVALSRRQADDAARWTREASDRLARDPDLADSLRVWLKARLGSPDRVPQ